MLSRKWLVPALLLVLALGAGAARAEWYTMKPGDNLWDLALSTYGNPRLYKMLAEYNDITNMYTIPVGKQIWLPSEDELNQMNDADNTAERLEVMDNARDNQDAADPPAQKVFRNPTSVLEIIKRPTRPQVSGTPPRAKPNAGSQ